MFVCLHHHHHQVSYDKHLFRWLCMLYILANYSQLWCDIDMGDILMFVHSCLLQIVVLYVTESLGTTLSSEHRKEICRYLYNRQVRCTHICQEINYG